MIKKILLWMGLFFSPIVLAQNVLILTGETDGWISSLVTSFQNHKGVNTVVVNNELSNTTAISSTIFDPGYDLLVLTSTFNTGVSTSLDWPIIEDAIQTRKVRGVISLIDSLTQVNDDRVIELIKTVGGTPLASISRNPTAIATADSDLNTANPSQGDFSALPIWEMETTFYGYNGVPSDNALYIDPVSGTTVTTIIGNSGSYGGNGACLVTATDMGWFTDHPADAPTVLSSYMNLVNNFGSACAVSLDNGGPILSITKSVLPETVVLGTAVTYTIVVSNTVAAATNTLIKDLEPSGIQFDSITCTPSGAAICNDPNGTALPISGSIDASIFYIPAGDSVTLTINGTVTAENLNYTNTATITPATGASCSTCSATVTSKLLIAQDDSGNITDPYTGGVAITSVIDNDTLGGVNIANIANIILTDLGTGTGTGILTLDTTTGTISAASGVAAGQYTLDYEVCDAVTTTVCTTATATVTVLSATINAQNDMFSSIPSSYDRVVLNVLDNDQLNNTVISDITLVTLTELSGSGALMFDTITGDVTVAANTLVGNYILDYQICEVLNPTNCSVATVAVSVAKLSAPQRIPTMGIVGFLFLTGLLLLILLRKEVRKSL